MTNVRQNRALIFGAMSAVALVSTTPALAQRYTFREMHRLAGSPSDGAHSDG